MKKKRKKVELDERKGNIENDYERRRREKENK